MTPHVASSMALRARLGALRNLRLDSHEISLRAGIDEDLLADPDHFLPESSIWALWRVASEEYGGSALGLRAGANVPFGAYGVLNYLTMTATTLGEGLQLLVRYWPLVGTGKSVEIVHGPDGIHRFCHTPNLPLAGAGLHCRDYTLAVMANHMVARSGLRPVEIEFAGPALGSATEYSDLLGTRVSFGHAQTAMVFEDRVWNTELPGGDPPLVRTLEEHAASLVRQLPKSRGTVALAAREIAARLSDGKPGVHTIARCLAVSERTLQRRLRQEGCTFEGLVELVRRDVATEYLKDPSLSITEIAYLMGYSGPAAFHRAFKQWTGSTPRRSARSDA